MKQEEAERFVFLISRNVANLVGKSYHSLELQRGREIGWRSVCD